MHTPHDTIERAHVKIWVLTLELQVWASDSNGEVVGH
jgi:hypothetical protein